MKVFTLCTLMFISAHMAMAQAARPTPTPSPDTKLELFQAKDGAVIIRAFERAGGMVGLGGNVSVEAVELTDAQTGIKQQGIAIEVRDVSRNGRESRAYVDYDEIDSLLKGLTYVGKVDSTVTKLTNFEATYPTKGGLKIFTFNEGSNYNFGVQVGRLSSQDAYFKVSELVTFTQLINVAKAKLDAAK
jgi:hypothetical protein